MALHRGNRERLKALLHSRCVRATALVEVEGLWRAYPEPSSGILVRFGIALRLCKGPPGSVSF